MKTHKNLEIKSRQLKEANLNDKDLDIVMYAVAHSLISDLNDRRSKGCEGAVNGIYHALKSQGRNDLNDLIEQEIHEHSPFEMMN